MSPAGTAAAQASAPGSHATQELRGPLRPGRRFEPVQEKLLDEDLVKLSTRLPRAAQGVAIVREFSGGRGVADVVAVTSWQEAAEARFALGLPFLRNETDCSVVAALSPNQTRTTPSLAYKLGMSENQIVRRLRALSTAGYVESSGTGFRRAPGLEPIGRTYALEAKVRDWRQGTSQALRYSTWCDAAAVVLLRDPRNLVDVKSHFAGLGLGLASEGRWIVRPRIGRTNAGLRFAASEQFAQQLSTSPAF